MLTVCNSEITTCWNIFFKFQLTVIWIFSSSHISSLLLWIYLHSEHKKNHHILYGERGYRSDLHFFRLHYAVPGLVNSVNSQYHEPLITESKQSPYQITNFSEDICQRKDSHFDIFFWHAAFWKKVTREFSSGTLSIFLLGGGWQLSTAHTQNANKIPSESIIPGLSEQYRMKISLHLQFGNKKLTKSNFRANKEKKPWAWCGEIVGEFHLLLGKCG